MHSLIHSGKGLFRCTNCTNMYTTRAAMDTHRLVQQQQKFQCDNCNLSTDTAANLTQHQGGKQGAGKLLVARDMIGLQKCSAINTSVLSA